MNRYMGRLIAGATTAAVMAGIVGYSQKTEAAFSAPVNVAISANVAANCVLTAGSVAFGAYQPLGAHDTAPLDQTGTFTVRCVKGVTANVGLNDGLTLLGHPPDERWRHELPRLRAVPGLRPVDGLDQRRDGPCLLHRGEQVGARR